MNNKAKQQWDKRAAECSNLFKVVKTDVVHLMFPLKAFTCTNLLQK